MKKKLSQIQWHGNQVDSEGVPVIPEAAPAGLPMEGLNEGELYVHTHSSHPSIWIRNDEGEVVEISGSGGGAGGDTSIFLRKDRNDETKHVLGVGGLKFQQKPIDRFIRYYDEDKPEEVSDADFYSALATDMKIEESREGLDKRYLRKDKEDTAQKHIEFQEGITVHQMAKMENIDVEVLARIAKAFVTQIGSEKFVDGFFGEGYQIWKAIATGDWNFTIDRLTVRKVMTVYELIVQKIRSVGGMVVVSAGNGKVKEVEQVGLEYKFTFEDENTFQVHDLMRCQVWTGSGVKYYWVEVVRVEDGAVYTRVADFAGVEPSAGDEVVLMGNTQNPLRQGLVLISAAEDGQPRVDVLDGVKTTNFDDCLKARLGGLDGITDSRFPADMQPQGYGLYANNCYLTGVFVLSNGKDVQTQFAIMEGMIRANMSSIQQQINAEDNYLSNASMTTNLIGWEFNNDVKVFRTSGGLLHFNGNFYSIKNAIAGIVPNGEKTVLRLKNSFVRQRNAGFAMHPTFDLVEQMTTDADGKDVGTGVMLYRPRMFYVSFRYMVTKRGTLRVYFENEQKRNDFEEYEPLNYTKVLEAGNSFMVTDDFLSGKWNGTGDFYLSFDGDMYLYDLALSDDPLSDMEERWSMQLEITEKKIQANAEHIIQQGQNLEEYRSEFLYTAEQLRTEFTSLVQNEKKDITEAYTGLVTQTAQSLTSDYNAKIGNYYGKVTEEYNSKITQTAKDITTSLTAKIDATDKAIGDLEVGLKADYNAKISASATSLQSDYNSKITDLRTGDIATMKSSIEQQAGQIALKASQSNVDALTGRVSEAESNIVQNANNISLSVKKDGVIAAINLSNETATIQANRINLTGVVTYQMLNGSLQNTLNGKATSSELLVVQNSLNNSVTTLNNTISALQTDVNSKASTASLNSKVTELNNALSTKISGSVTTDSGNRIVNAVIGGSTLISGGYIHADYIKAEDLEVGALRAVKGKYIYNLNANGFVITRDTTPKNYIYGSALSVSSAYTSVTFSLYYNDTLVDKETIPVVNYDEGYVRLELDNEMQSVACDENGYVIFGLPLTTGVRMYCDTEELTISSINVSAPYGVTAVREGNTVRVSSITGTTAEVFDINISATATYRERIYTRSAALTIKKIKKGSDTLLLDLAPSDSVIKIVSGSLRIPSSVSCKVKQTTSSGVITTPSSLPTGYYMTVAFDADSDPKLCDLFVNDYYGYFRMSRRQKYFSMDGRSLMYSSPEGLTTLSGEGLSLSGGAAITGLTLGNINTSGISSFSDFVVMSGNYSLPAVNACKGKVIFIRFKGKRTLNGNIIPRNSGNSVTSVEHEDISAFYLSDGTYWYEFLCY